MRIKILLFSIASSCFLFGTSLPEPNLPWFTGPLLAGSGQTIPEGHINWEPFFVFTDEYGKYNRHWRQESTPDLIQILTELIVQYGLNSFMDMQIEPEILWQKKQGSSSFAVGDFPVIFGFQALKETKGSWKPDLRIILSERFPLGKYQKLNPDKNGTDSSGTGSYRTTLGFNFQKLFTLAYHTYLRIRLNLHYGLSTPVSVSGFNTYGGGFNTKGKVKPGDLASQTLSMEYTITKNWVFACDLHHRYQKKTSFSGRKGTTKTGSIASIGNGPSNQISLAPAIEYNFNENFGIIGGLWFSMFGRNSASFVSGAIGINIYQ